MNNSLFTHWGSWFTLVAIVLLTTWLNRDLDKKLPHLPQPVRANPDYTLTDFKTVRMDPTGQLVNQLEAEKMVHYPNAETQLQKPSLIFYKQKQATWFVNAERATVSPDGNTILFLGKTTFFRPATPRHQRLTIISENVQVNKLTQVAETQAAAQLLTDASTTHSVGMRFQLTVEHLELYSQVRGHYVAQ